MHTIKTIFIIYLCYLAIDGILRLWKLFAIIAEYGFLLTIIAISDLIIYYLKKPFSSNESLLKIINHFVVEPEVGSFTDILLYPTRIIDSLLRRLAVCCVMRKSMKSGLSHNNWRIAMTSSQLWFIDAGMPFGPKRIPILGLTLYNLFFILEYHISLIINVYPTKVIDGFDENSLELKTVKKNRKDLFSESYFIKLFRLLITDIVLAALIYLVVFKAFP